MRVAGAQELMQLQCCCGWWEGKGILDFDCVYLYWRMILYVQYRTVQYW